MLTPSHYYIDAWEDTDALVITRAEMIGLLNPIPAFAELTRKLDERNSIANQRRVNASISLSAEKRYEELANTYPEFLKRFPQHIIASYLGITKETLSRIRHQATNK
jgi:CRP-like cAMP-binding protein